MVDQAGNYTFEIFGQQHRVMKMNVFQQRDFTTVIGNSMVVDAEGYQTMNPMTDGFNSAQDKLMHLIQHRDANGAWHSLDPTNSYFESKYLPAATAHNGDSQLNVLMGLFMKMVSELTVNFTGTGQVSDQTSSNQESVESSEDQNTPNLLSQTLVK